MDYWGILIGSLYDDDGEHRPKIIPGQNLREWLDLGQFDYNEVDRIYVDCETIGGA